MLKMFLYGHAKCSSVAASKTMIMKNVSVKLKPILTLLFASVVLAAAAQSITVTAPNGGEEWQTGYNKTITWASAGVSNVNIEFTDNAGATWNTIVSNQANTGSYVWNVSSSPSYWCKIKITDATNVTVFDTSDTYFITGPVVSVNAGTDTLLCFGETTQLYASAQYIAGQAGGGPPPPPPALIYEWSPAMGLSNSTVANPIASPTVTTTYTVTVTAGGATATDQVTISVSPAISVSLTTQNISCAGASDGSVCASGVGGVSPYIYVWSNGVSPIGCIISLQAGQYSVAVTDANSCTATATTTITQPSPLVVNIINPGDGVLPDTLEAVVSGGCPNYTYMWGTTPGGSQYICTVPFNNGLQQVGVQDCNGCWAADTIAIGLTVTYPNGGQNLVANQPLTITWNSAGNVSGNVKIEAYSSIAFNWVTIAASAPNTSAYNMIVPNLPGTQSKIRISDVANANIVDESDAHFNIVAGSSLQIDSFSVNDVSCYGLSDGSVTVFASGGTPPYTYSIDGGATFQSLSLLSNLPIDTYVVYVKDADNVQVNGSVTVFQPSQLTAQLVSSTGGVLPDTLFTSATGGTPPYTYLGSNSTTVAYMYVDSTFFPMGSNCFWGYVADENGCTATTDTMCYVCLNECVWPGDANYDGVVDNNDLLPIGLAYATTGTARAQQDISWYAHTATDWIDTLTDGTNYKHIDCNGNGTINADDTLAILQNFALTHPRSGQPEPRGNVPTLRIEMMPDTLADGETVIAHLLLGDSNFTATNVYALAFTFNFDPLVVDSNEYGITFSNNSWLCSNATDHIDLAKKLFEQGEIRAALTRIDQTSRSGSGEIGSVSMKITTGNINGKDLSYYAMHTYISDLIVIDEEGNHVLVDAGADSAEVAFEPSGIYHVEFTSDIKLYPNPSKQQITISSGSGLINSIQIFDALGQLMISTHYNTVQHATINCSELPQAVYTVFVQSDSGIGYAKFIKE